MPDRLSTLWSQTFHIFSGDESESDGIEKKKCSKMYRALLALVSKNFLQHYNKQDKKFHYSSFSHILRLHGVVGVYKRGVNRGVNSGFT